MVTPTDKSQEGGALPPVRKRLYSYNKQGGMMDKATQEVPAFLRVIDGINERVGRIICFSFAVIMLIQVMEVVLRYVFNSPTIWAWDVNSQMFSGTAILGGGYVLLYDSHVRMDLLYGRVKPKTKLVFDLVSFPLILLAFALVIWKGGEMALYAFQTKARGRSFFAPLLWPVKSTLFFAAILIFLQALANFIKVFITFRKSKMKG